MTIRTNIGTFMRFTLNLTSVRTASSKTEIFREPCTLGSFHVELHTRVQHAGSATAYRFRCRAGFNPRAALGGERLPRVGECKGWLPDQPIHLVLDLLYQVDAMVC